MVFALVSMVSVALLSPAPETGKMLLAGGGDETHAMIREYIDLCGGPMAKIVVLAQTRAEPKVTGREHIELLRACGAVNTVLVNDDQINDARRTEVENILEDANGVFVPGGDQNLFIDRWGLSWSHRVMRGLIARGVAYFGTSAGAMVTSNPMIAGWNDDGTLKIRSGLGLHRWLIDTHYVERNRQDRLLFAFNQSRYYVGRIGLNEPDWIIIRGNEVTIRNGQPFIAPK